MPAAKVRSDLLSNPRFYILTASVILSALVAAYLRLSLISGQLYLIRLEQVFGYLAVFYWFVALLATPLSQVYDKTGPIRHLLFARRAIGVSAAYFALLHASIALWGQTGGLAGLSLLPAAYFQAIMLGLIALTILLLMAATSFDKVIAVMTFPRWKQLHRLGYLAGILAMLHIWLIGTHMVYSPVRALSFIMLSLLFWLEARRITTILVRRYPRINSAQTVVVLAIWLSATFALLALPQALPSHHDARHTYVQQVSA